MKVKRASELTASPFFEVFDAVMGFLNNIKIQRRKNYNLSEKYLDVIIKLLRRIWQFQIFKNFLRFFKKKSCIYSRMGVYLYQVKDNNHKKTEVNGYE